jgi:SAM-dependent methyltransferase
LRALRLRLVFQSISPFAVFLSPNDLQSFFQKILLDMEQEDQLPWDWDATPEAQAELEAADRTVPLFFTSAEICASPQAALNYTTKHIGFDFSAYCLKRRLDTYQRIRAVNYIRTCKEGQHDQALAELNSDSPLFLNSEDYLQPVLPNDPMLRHAMSLGEDDDYDDWSAADGVDKEQEAAKTAPPPPAMLNSSTAPTPPTTGKGKGGSLNDREVELTRRLARATELLKAYGVQDEDEQLATAPDNDTYYFDSYSHWGIHQEMLTDVVRTEAYQHAIEKNHQYFAGKTVLDIGCGTGILSMFAARAGAKKVVGIDMSTMAFKAMENVKENGLEHIVKIIHGKVEDLGERGSLGEETTTTMEGERKTDQKNLLLQPNSFDIILSEWMGYALVFECMLETVLKARDVWLKKDGLVLPNIAEVYVQGLGDLDEWGKAVGYWSDVYGFKMTAMKSLVLPEAHVFVVKEDSVVGQRHLLHTYDIGTVKPEDLDIRESAFSLKMSKDENTLTGLCISFDCEFSSKLLMHNIKLPTGPEETPTHWKQTVLWLPEPLVIETNGADHVVNGTLTIARNSQNPRNLDFVMMIGENVYKYKM